MPLVHTGAWSKASRSPRANDTNALWGTWTPLGRPVDPEV